ncbi:hypothetical protein Dsin_031985 [Dipteronia sinensis]|uniref:Kinesin motor domain-containing protein n=1 Tax=Dipteronia sinensis TaxID=43782 RepID=A0AAE0DSV5_9ROSI|nr:hypothetical protein Dsin_031985 [Dipteronia sinensis]
MECFELKESSQNVRVDVDIWPLITPELLVGCINCITVVHGEPQTGSGKTYTMGTNHSGEGSTSTSFLIRVSFIEVQIGSHTFTYDNVFGNIGSPPTTIYDVYVAPLVEALFHRYNATVLAYGQTGSEKTYMIGTNYSSEGRNSGFMLKIFKDEVFDLLDMDSSSLNKGDEAFSAKPAVHVGCL